MARFELGRAEEALDDVNFVLKELKDAKSQKEASDLKHRIEDKLQQLDAAKGTAKVQRPAEDVPKEASDDTFQAASSFQGARPGYVFKTGARGLGYYRDPKQQGVSRRLKLP